MGATRDIHVTTALPARLSRQRESQNLLRKRLIGKFYAVEIERALFKSRSVLCPPS